MSALSDSARRMLGWGVLAILATVPCIAQEAVGPLTGSPSSVPGTTGLLIGVGGLLSFAGSKAWDYLQNRRGNEARDKLAVGVNVNAADTIARQETRIQALEGKVESLETARDQESALRRATQEIVVSLRLRVAHLESVLRDHDIDLPQTPTLPE